MKANRKIKRRRDSCFDSVSSTASLDEGRARQVAQRIAASRHRGALAILSDFQRLVRLDRDRHTAVVESAAPLTPACGTTSRLASRASTAGPRSHLRRESGADRRDAHQGRQRRLRRQRAGPAGGARGTAVTSCGVR